MIVLSLFCNTYETLRLQFEESIFYRKKISIHVRVFLQYLLVERSMSRSVPFQFTVCFFFVLTGLSINQLYVGDIIPSFRACRITFLVTEVLVSKR